MSFENMIGQQEDTGLESNQTEFNGFPLIMWQNGDPGSAKMGLDALEYVGGWFTGTWYRHNDEIVTRIPDGADKTDYQEIDLAPYGWRKDYFSNSRGERVDGWYRRNIEAALICGRERWLVHTEDQKNTVLAFTNYKDAEKVGGPRGNQQVLALVKGMEAFGPVVFTFKGYPMMSFKGTREFMADGVMTNLRRHVTDPVAAKLAKPGQKPPHINYRSVWCPMGPKVVDNKPQFIKAGKGDKSKMIVVPTYVGRKWTIEDIDLAAVYVGDAVNAQANQAFDDNKEWAGAWANLNGETDNAEASEAAKGKAEEAQSLNDMAAGAGL
jgi:hypothetical protein